ncbi:ferritin-like domain-containing protein [Undibacterium sp. SXout11W]|uniref:ferritin-like domain-containing protein n=1 Tax=Undibacterium sp. SXout11W TaxID=3413050 RepID=UPI003BF266C0
MNKHPSPDQMPRRRQQLLFVETDFKICGSITSIDKLRSHLQTAIEIEHSTIPTYLCALYSINAQSNSFAYQTIQSIVMEEMLHMILAANILNAIGGSPAINKPEFIPEYPTYLPHSDKAFLVPLQKLSKDTLTIFLDIEKPKKRLAPPEADNYKTIGQFYDAIKHALRYFDFITPGGIFTGKKERQVSSHHYYGGGGKLIPIFGLSDAIEAINEIIGQGEGMNGSIIDPDHKFFDEEIEYAHYFRFNEIMLARRYQPTDAPQDPPSGSPVQVNWDDVLNMQPNPKMKDYPKGSELWNKTYEFNRTYITLLTSIHDACNGNPELLMKAIPLMYDLKYKALDLMNTPIGNGKTAGPSFEYVPL